ncbi:MAG TPA: M56 family metallopeptidase [Thermoanaerobaculia bacterium]|nr:M56 family metallopeptidase [Thermoanaerobaculia bacterium]
MFADHAIAWVITYVLHSTLLLGLAWLGSRRLARWSVRAEEVVWRVALVGGLVTASLQIAAGWEPLAGRWSLPEIGSGSAPAAVEAPVAERVSAPVAFSPALGRALPVREAAPAAPASSFSAPAVGLTLWAFGALLLLARCMASVQGFSRRLRHRPRVIGGTLHTQLERLAERSGLRRPVRLTCSSRVPVPVALGLREPEICVPPRALVGLTAEQQEGLLAHELAHVARRDTFWLVFNQVLASVLFFQPLNWVARRRLREISELLSDEWAVGRTGRPVSLARCLAEVAGWSTRSVRALPVPGMADRPSNLGLRIRRLLDEARSPERPVRPLWLGIALVALLAGVVVAAPVVSAAVEDDAAVMSASGAFQEPDESEEEAESAEEAEEEAREEDEGEESWEDSDEDELEADIEEELDWESEELEQAFESFGEAFETAFEGFEPAFEHAFEGLDMDFDESFDIAALEELEDLGEDLADLAEGHEMSPEERKRLEQEMERVSREMERVSRQVEESLRPHMQKLQQEMERLQPEMERMQREIEKSLQPEMEKLHRQLDSMRPELERLEAEARRLQAEGGLSDEERERIAREARRLAQEASERAMASADVQRAIAESQKQSREAMRKALEAHRAELDRMRQEIDEQTRALRDEARREVERNQRERRREHRKDKEQDEKF